MKILGLKELPSSLWIRFLRIHNHFSRDLTKALDTFGITLTQFYMLATIDYTGDIPFSELSRRLWVTMGNLTGVIDRLEGKGLVVRERDNNDRRIIHVKMTRKGKEITEKAGTAFEHTMKNFLKNLNKQEQQELSILLKKILPKEVS
ncbi:MAG: MarR family transcriptional regulator [Thermodesulfobacteriota bacterium]|nr:MarR family transcriptional regulator [Thermodesulfobacteriota bacterium]